ncbi:MAG TPA: LysM peptidoglycan-binding domain-containing protein [Rhodocyclaceae bacterium]|nr:LysM peptidoglycan-binding domain-containing protein [Rhodocyclaceae bacterium]
MLRIISALILAVTATCAFAQEKLKLVDNPPERHIVVQGDTLWGIAGNFMKEPWRWPEIWRLNKTQIKNPHLIYPGDIVVLDMSGGNPRLTLAKPIKLAPQVYSSEVKKEIPTIPQNVIEPFLSRPLVLGESDLNDVPRIIATQEDRVLIGNNDIAYVSGIPDNSREKWSIYRPGKPITDPVTKEVLGYEAFDLGTARLLKSGTPATIRISTAREEIARGDRLLPAPRPSLTSYVPRAPGASVSGQILAIYGGLSEGGRHSVVQLNRGSKDGLEVGHVLAMFRKTTAAAYDENNRRVMVEFPEERYGVMLVFRTFDRVSYGLVMDASRSMLIGDAVRNP